MPSCHEKIPNLPPEEYRLFNPANDELIETPLDYRGLVDLDELIRQVKFTVVPEYSWQSKMNDVHHLQWYAGLYQNHQDHEIAVQFRGLANRMAYVPRVFHNWTHRITLPPPVPEVEVMRHSIEAQRVAISLFETASRALRLVRAKKLGERALSLKLENAFEYYNVYLDEAREVPSEFSLVKIEDIEAKSVEDMLSVNRLLGQLALNRIPHRDRAIKESA